MFVAPCRRRVKLLARLDPRQSYGCSVNGIAELCEKIYIVGDADRIRVFGGSPSYDRLQDIVVPGMVYPVDIAADLISSRLYIADLTSQCIWKVELKDDIFDCGMQDSCENIKICNWVVIEDRPISLSVTKTGQVFVIDQMNNNLTIYIGQDETPEVVTLKDYGVKNARHVIQTSQETCFVIHGDSVSLVDRNWKFMKHYGGPAVPAKLSAACHMVRVGANGPLFVIDSDRILQLSSNLEIKRTFVLHPPPSEDPVLDGYALSYSRASGRLIAVLGGKYVYVYRLTESDPDSS